MILMSKINDYVRIGLSKKLKRIAADMFLIYLEPFCITPLRSVRNAFDGYRKVSCCTAQQENLTMPQSDNPNDNNKGMSSLSLPRAGLVSRLVLIFCLLFGIFTAKADLPPLTSGSDFWTGFIQPSGPFCIASSKLAAASCAANQFSNFSFPYTVSCGSGTYE
jgi:hypothetical protein